MKKIILASNSPRRKELLTQVGIEFEVISADIDEISEYMKASDVVCDLSQKKAKAVYNANPGRIVLAADTVVALDDEILGKPIDSADALHMLRRLSGRSHQVYTGVTIIEENGNVKTFYKCTEVEMYNNDDNTLMSYILTGEPMDKAGAYGIQGIGAMLVRGINGDYNNVVGLPISAVYRELKKLSE